jgi:hypothetical protein
MGTYRCEHGTFVIDSIGCADEESNSDRLARGGKFAGLYQHVGRDIGVAS